MKPLCIYHGNCADGFAAAWVVRQFFGDGNVDFHAGVYQTPPPDVTHRHVVIVDFSYKRPVLEEMASKALSLLILDHHKTAAEDLGQGLREPPPPYMYMDMVRGSAAVPGLCGIFDMARSGAGLTWDYFNSGLKRPALIDHIEDRDLWKFSMPRTREIQATIFSYPYDFKVWDVLMERNPAEFAVEGMAIERKHFKDIDELLQVVTRTMRIGGYAVPIANLPYTLASDAGHKLAVGQGTDESPDHPFAGCYWDTPEGRVFSLRSANRWIDVSEIAKAYGGGGHRNASGFKVSFEQARGFEI